MKIFLGRNMTMLYINTDKKFVTDIVRGFCFFCKCRNIFFLRRRNRILLFRIVFAYLFLTESILIL